ncbi:MAG: FkbM family methyltransferase [Nitrospirota bacterium]|nr:FkbM family methyltransferase [Nitrospirota bacterium]
MTNTFSVLTSLDDLPDNSKLALFGAGETGQEFVRKLRSDRGDVEVVCFFDSYREGVWGNIPIKKSSEIEKLDSNVELVITSVFWNEIADIVENTYSRKYNILSNDIINQCSHLSSYGPFYFENNNKNDLEKRLSVINDSFMTDKDREIIRKIFDLRVYKKEKEFFSFANKITRDQKSTFQTKDKYSEYLNLNEVRYCIEGGVFDGEDTYRLMETLKKSKSFKQLYAFDPFLNSLYQGDYYDKIDSVLCDFHENVLWDREEKIYFQVDKENPANSTVLRESELGESNASIKAHSAITIDSFLKSKNLPVDLIKLDVEGSEMNVLNGAKASISKWRPKMAVSLYHRREHLLEIAEFLLSIHKDYKFNISINNPTFVDMVLYAK